MTEVSTELQPQSTDYNPQDTGRLVLDIIQSRRCIREGFIDREISQDIIEEVVESGLRAPSSKHAQPWKLHIVTGRDQLLELSEKVFRAKTAESFAPSNPSTGKPREWESTVTLSAEVLRNVGLGMGH
jgi:nitroreductase